ncbi:MAG: histidine phosphatase family protein [Desulfatiglans sp.]|nr:histidine phosphatase family protein [Thermodesulfobacteriota bacterium]MEE4354275.1 histidine phosphatase family protein [Desulfatiglans sp.]
MTTNELERGPLVTADKQTFSGIRIVLIRHAETEWNRTHRFQGRSDIPLNHNGKKQAQALARALKGETFTAIYSSPLARARETARIVRSFHDSAPICEEEGLIEMDLGDFDGIGAQQWYREHVDFREAWIRNPGSVRMPGGEGLQDVQKRAVDTLDRITMDYEPGSTLAICSHNFVVLSILCHALEISLDRFRDLRQVTAAFSVIRKERGGLRVELINEQSHLREFDKS